MYASICNIDFHTTLYLKYKLTTRTSVTACKDIRYTHSKADTTDTASKAMAIPYFC